MKMISSYSLLNRIQQDQPLLANLSPLIAPWTQQRLRRVDRYIELCVAGGLNCVGGRKLTAETAVYLATRCGAVATPALAMENIISKHEMPKPIHFVNTLGNSAGFYLTQLLQITGNTVVISQESLSFEAALFHAWLDLQQGRISAALVGGIDEVVLPLEHHRQRLAATPECNFSEGSHWLLLERNLPEQNLAEENLLERNLLDKSSAEKTALQIGRPYFLQDITAVINWLAQHPVTHVQCAFEPTDEETQSLTQSAKNFSHFTQANAAHGVASGAALIHLSNLITPGNYGVHLARSNDGSYCALTLQLTSDEL